MSKNKEFEKKLEKEQIEKIKPEKEFKIEIKEKPEKREIKEYKELKLEKHEKIEKIEIKERIKDFKEFEKKLEKPGKEIVEGPGFDPGGIVFGAEKPEEGAVEQAAPKLEDLKRKEIEKIKPEKEFPDKFQKEIEKVKPEKEFEKWHKEIEKIKPEKEFPDKFQVKPEFEKPSAETRLDPGTKVFPGTGSPEERIGQLENALEKLTHFIGVDLRPDLSTGALKGESDVSDKADDKKKPK
ncbi:MAG TPA: hypothetical protein VFY51_08405 [Pyrinomonadaceae bacterium]|nr:hypothetical protein [Pyrinomonadaceae bacterium]